MESFGYIDYARFTQRIEPDKQNEKKRIFYSDVVFFCVVGIAVHS